MKLQTFALPIVTLAALGYASYSVYSSQPVRKSEPPPAAPPKTVYRDAVGAVGLIEASTENISISTPVPGLVTKVYVTVGDTVGKGDKLFELDARDLAAELAVRRQALAVARARLEKLSKYPRPEDIPAAEARVREAEAALSDATVQLQLIESVTDKRAIREEDLQRRKFAVQGAQARLDEAKAQLALLRSGTWKEDLSVAKSEVALAEANVKRIEADLERLTVRALIAGKVLQCNVRPGEYAASGPLPKPLMLLGDVGSLHVRVDVDEADAPKVKPAAEATAMLRGKADAKFGLEFVRFEPYVVPKRSLTGDSTERVDTRVLQVIYRIKGDAPTLFVGQQMDVFINGGAK